MCRGESRSPSGLRRRWAMRTPINGSPSAPTSTRPIASSSARVVPTPPSFSSAARASSVTSTTNADSRDDSRAPTGCSSTAFCTQPTERQRPSSMATWLRRTRTSRTTSAAASKRTTFSVRHHHSGPRARRRIRRPICARPSATSRGSHSNTTASAIQLESPTLLRRASTSSTTPTRSRSAGCSMTIFTAFGASTTRTAHRAATPPFALHTVPRSSPAITARYRSSS